MKVASNTGAAEAAVSGFANTQPDSTGQQATLGSSNIASMQDGAAVTNSILGSISDLVSSVNGQADRVTALATAFEDRDKQDAAGLK